MYEFFVNHQPVSTSIDGSLLDFLRDECRLTSVKNGCAQGACGACTVLCEGKAVRACTQKTAKLVGKHILTVEGLTQLERQVYATAFAKVGAVQCGFCTPGMVLSAKALLDVCPHPTSDQIKLAIKNNICRCTGYQKIVQAILLCAQIFANPTLLKTVQEKSQTSGAVGASLPRTDAAAKVLGTAQYADDLYVEGMLYGSALRTRYARAKVVRIDLEKALAHPQTVAILTAQDLPGAKKIGHIVQDWDVLIAQGECTRTIGDSLALVCATSKQALAQIKALIDVTYEVLTPLTSPQHSLLSNVCLHEGGNVLYDEHIRRGDAHSAIQCAAHVVTQTYVTPFTEHAFLEPECALALPTQEGVTIYCADQGIYQTRKECARATGLPEEKVRVIATMVGGGFGGKEDMSVQHHAAILALAVKKPVKVTLTRDESIRVHPKRHAMQITVTTACDENGYLLATQAHILADTGAYASLGNPVVQRACTHLGGPYNYQNFDVQAQAVYTNNPPAGAFRGFGVAQACFAIESNLNRLAEQVGISAWQMRHQNAIRPGQVLPNGQIADDSTALVQTLEAVKDVYERNPYAGIACALKNSGVGVGLQDVGRCRLRVQNAQVCVYTSAACIGQGLATVLTQMVCTAAELLPKQVRVCPPDTANSPNAGNTTASRQTVFTGEAARVAACKLAAALREAGTLQALEGKTFDGEYAAQTDPIDSKKAHPHSHVSYGYATQVVVLDEQGRVQNVTAAHDVGKAINPISLQGQIEGGVLMGLGFALTEDFPLTQGVPTAKFGTLGLFKADQAPPVDCILIERCQSLLAYGAKGVGEICLIPTAPAVAHAYAKLDGKWRTALPLAQTAYR